MKNLHMNHYPTLEELYALEAKARRLRAEALSELLRKASASIKGLFAHTPRIARHA